MCRFFGALTSVTLIWVSSAQGSPKVITAAHPDLTQIEQICPLIDSTARAYGLPVAFFAHVIWQESRFQPNVVGPATLSGERAEGIAQFMPGTAAERNLTQPFNPADALPKSAEFLAELRSQFGNLGLAAAAYNAGPQRVRDYLAGFRGLPEETRNYVLAITGRSVEDWVAERRTEQSSKGGNAIASPGVAKSCADLIALLQSESHPALSEESRKVPSWCSGLRQPNVKVCGNVHMNEAPRVSGLTLTTSGHVGLTRTRVHLSTSHARQLSDHAPVGTTLAH